MDALEGKQTDNADGRSGRLFRCNCKDVSDRFCFTNLGFGRSEAEIRKALMRRVAAMGSSLKIRMIEVYEYKVNETEAEWSQVKGSCIQIPEEEDLIKQNDEDVVVTFKRRPGHYCKAVNVVVTISRWQAMELAEADDIYEVLARDTINSIKPQERESTDGTDCDCNEEGTRTYYCGCIRHRMEENCSMWTRGLINAGFKYLLANESGEEPKTKAGKERAKKRIAEKRERADRVMGKINRTADIAGPHLEMLAKDTFEAQTKFSVVAEECRIGEESLPEDRPFSGSTIVAATSTHAHLDTNNDDPGCSALLVFCSKEHRSGELDNPQPHVLLNYSVKKRKGRGIGFCLPHGSLHFENAAFEPHGSPKCDSDHKGDPHRIGVVLYKHRFCDLPNHGKEVREQRKNMNADKPKGRKGNCEVCGKRFKNKTILKAHMEAEHAEVELSEEELEVHESSGEDEDENETLVEHPQPEMEASEVDAGEETEVNREGDREHESEHSGEPQPETHEVEAVADQADKDRICQYCGQWLSDRWRRETHEQRHCPSRPRELGGVGVGNLLELPHASHRESPVFKCPVPSCGKVDTSWPRLHKHLWKHWKLSLKQNKSNRDTPEVEIVDPESDIEILEITGVTEERMVGGEISQTDDEIVEIETVESVKDENFKCNACGYACATKEHLERHTSAGCGYICRYCERRFETSSERRRHQSDCQFNKGHEVKGRLTQKPSNVEELSQGEVSDESYASEISEGSELEGVTDDEESDPQLEKAKRYMCQRCGFKGRDSWDLKTHQRTVHEGIKKFECTLCDYKAGQQGHLRIHIQGVHEGVKKFECDKCSFKTAQRWELKRHEEACMRIKKREENRQFTCDTCGKRFLHNWILERHRHRVHEAEKELKCEKCDFKTNQSRLAKHHLKKHMESRHRDDEIRGKSRSGRSKSDGNNVLEEDKICIHCGKRFASRSNVARHQRLRCKILRNEKGK